MPLLLLTVYKKKKKKNLRYTLQPRVNPLEPEGSSGGPMKAKLRAGQKTAGGHSPRTPRGEHTTRGKTAHGETHPPTLALLVICTQARGATPELRRVTGVERLLAAGTSCGMWCLRHAGVLAWDRGPMSYYVRVCMRVCWCRPILTYIYMHTYIIIYLLCLFIIYIYYCNSIFNIVIIQ